LDVTQTFQKSDWLNSQHLEIWLDVIPTLQKSDRLTPCWKESDVICGTLVSLDLFFWPLTFDLMQTNRPTNAFNFFRMTLPSVEGKMKNCN
jgi:hypothetical protein